MSKYIYAVGRHKGSIAKLKLYTAEQQEILVSEKKLSEYFPTLSLQSFIYQPLKFYPHPEKLKMVYTVSGGGKVGQVKACRLALSRALIELDPELRPALKASGFLTRDSRIKERKKPGLKRARRAPQWQKR
ncbi:MAG: 30S ribosomal protein S9 [Candidatus Buchananbacteria bacterium]